MKRIAGEPGDHVRISEGKLFINDKHVPLKNSRGEIAYDLPLGAESMAIETDLTVPDGQYYMLGDNRNESCDSRTWGSVPRSSLIGPLLVTYWPPTRLSFH